MYFLLYCIFATLCCAAFPACSQVIALSRGTAGEAFMAVRPLQQVATVAMATAATAIDPAPLMFMRILFRVANR